jgi:hypothetical protein
MMSALEVPEAVYELIHKMVFGTNYCSFKYLHVECKERLMSGIVWTSLGNSLMNFLIMAFLSSRVRNVPWNESAEHLDRWFFALFEGDDGITRDYGIRDEDIQAMGLDLKRKSFKNYSLAHFCGNVFDPEVRSIVTDPSKILLKFFYLDVQYMNCRDKVHEKLLRAKALSYKYLYNDVPIVGPLCQKVCDLTRGIDVRGVPIEEYGPFQYLGRALELKLWKNPPKIDERTRNLVADLYKIPVAEQLIIEKDLAESAALDCSYAQLYNKTCFEHSSWFVRSSPEESVVRHQVVSAEHAQRLSFIQNVVDYGFGEKTVNEHDRRYLECRCLCHD